MRELDMNRRTFLSGAALAVAGCVSGRPRPKLLKAGDRLNMGFVGVGGKGVQDLLEFVRCGENPVCLCDVDRGLMDIALGHLKKAGFDTAKIRCYADFRKMIDANPHMDAVCVSTPDHMHAAPAVYAMRAGMHVYVQKPLVRTLWELRRFEEVARETGVITQMGNQGSSGKVFRRNVEVLQAGVIGEVRDVHMWMDHPVGMWLQGNAARAALAGPADPVPADLDWDLWLGICAARPYKHTPLSDDPHVNSRYDKSRIRIYHEFGWRGLLDFGSGVLGDQACHSMNLPFRGLEFGALRQARCVRCEERNDVTYPARAEVELVFGARPSRARPGVTLPETRFHWYEGKYVPDKALMEPFRPIYGNKWNNCGCLIIGSKGLMFSPGIYGQQSFVVMNGEKKPLSVLKHPACTGVPETLPRRPEALMDGQYNEFGDAIRGTTPVIESVHSRCYSDIAHSVPMLEAMLVGVAAERVEADALAWDHAAQRFDNAAANALIRPYIRPGWEF